jgi:hypothetical protein
MTTSGGTVTQHVTETDTIHAYLLLVFNELDTFVKHVTSFLTDVFQQTNTPLGVQVDEVVVTYSPPPVGVSIDIKPGSFPNSINPYSKGKIPVAILSTETFHAPSMVKIDLLTFGHTGDEQSLAFCNQTPEDVNGDGLPDLVCHFYTQKTGLQTGDTEALLKGSTTTGVIFTARD